MSTTTPVGNSTSTSGNDAIRNGSVVGPGGAMGKDEFLKLLTTQLKYQDPMNPQDGQQMAAQLAQFSSVEQLTQINEALAAQSTQFGATTQAMNNAVAISAIGKHVTAPGDLVTVPATAPEATKISVNIPSAGSGSLKIVDDTGKVISSQDLGTVTPGLKEFALGNAGKGLPAGNYHYRVDVTGTDGKTVNATTYTTLLVDGVSYSAEGAVLTSGTTKIPIGTVIRIEN
jgi:flagellar basal-body rod modification protein FlgD